MMVWPSQRRQAGVLALVFATGCIHPNTEILNPGKYPNPIALCTPEMCRDSLSLTYLGASGFIVRHGGEALMTGLSFSHPRMLTAISPWPLRPDKKVIRKMLEGQTLGDVRTVVAVHSHYDHLADMPYILRHHLGPTTRIYGSPTMRHILRGDRMIRERDLAHSVADSVGSAWKAGRWIYTDGKRIRFMPLLSSHAPNFAGRVFFGGKVTRDRTNLPRSARGWKLGETYAYLIDLLGADGRVQFRIVYHDAAPKPGYVFLPPLPEVDRRNVDVAILCVGNYGAVPDYPTVMFAALRPRYAVLGHWEDFFRSPLAPLEGIPLTDTKRLASRLRATLDDRWATPKPGEALHFRY